MEDQGQVFFPFDLSLSQVATNNQDMLQAFRNVGSGMAGGGDGGQSGGTGDMIVKKGPLMKACWDLSQGGNQEKAANIPN